MHNDVPICDYYLSDTSQHIPAKKKKTIQKLKIAIRRASVLSDKYQVQSESEIEKNARIKKRKGMMMQLALQRNTVEI